MIIRNLPLLFIITIAIVSSMSSTTDCSTCEDDIDSTIELADSIKFDSDLFEDILLKEKYSALKSWISQTLQHVQKALTTLRKIKSRSQDQVSTCNVDIELSVQDAETNCDMAEFYNKHLLYIRNSLQRKFDDQSAKEVSFHSTLTIPIVKKIERFYKNYIRIVNELQD